MANPRRTTRRSSAVRPRPAGQAAGPVAVAAESAPPVAAKRVDLKSEYAYVIADIRQLGIVTASVFALLLIVGFFL